MVVEIANVDGAESRYHGSDKTILNLLVTRRKQTGEYKSEPIHIPPIDIGETDIDVRIRLSHQLTCTGSSLGFCRTLLGITYRENT